MAATTKTIPGQASLEAKINEIARLGKIFSENIQCWLNDTKYAKHSAVITEQLTQALDRAGNLLRALKDGKIDEAVICRLADRYISEIENGERKVRSWQIFGDVGDHDLFAFTFGRQKLATRRAYFVVRRIKELNNVAYEHSDNRSAALLRAI